MNRKQTLDAVSDVRELRKSPQKQGLPRSPVTPCACHFSSFDARIFWDWVRKWLSLSHFGDLGSYSCLVVIKSIWETNLLSQSFVLSMAFANISCSIHLNLLCVFLGQYLKGHKNWRVLEALTPQDFAMNKSVFLSTTCPILEQFQQLNNFRIIVVLW